jgi:hypothetical protein
MLHCIGFKNHIFIFHLYRLCCLCLFTNYVTGALSSQKNSALALIHYMEIPAIMCHNVGLFRRKFIQYIKNYHFESNGYLKYVF